VKSVSPHSGVVPGTGCITDVPGIQVGHAQDMVALTGCTVVLCRRGAVAGVDVRGGAPGTRETDLLSPLNLVSHVHAILLAGGSAFGLSAADGAMKYLERHKIGFPAGIARVPIVPAAIVFDLGIGSKDVRPDASMGYEACQSASAEESAEGNIGAGTGASVGKLFGIPLAMKSGLGTASLRVGRLVVGALAVVNSLGDVVNPETGEIVAGLRSGRIGPLRVGGRGYFADTVQSMKRRVGRSALSLAGRTNTVIAVVATNARLNKVEATKVAQMAHDGVAVAIRPAHTMLDGDTIFALSCGRMAADVSVVGTLAAEAMAQAILRAVMLARSAGGLPGLYES
jgi:L-aminopeptidase/D-esterase-like protein